MTIINSIPFVEPFSASDVEVSKELTIISRKVLKTYLDLCVEFRTLSCDDEAQDQFFNKVLAFTRDIPKDMSPEEWAQYRNFTEDKVERYVQKKLQLAKVVTAPAMRISNEGCAIGSKVPLTKSSFANPWVQIQFEQLNQVFPDSSIYQVRGNGNCGLYSFGLGWLKTRNETKTNFLADEIRRLEEKNGIKKSDAEIVLEGIEKEHSYQSLIKNHTFMHAFSRVLRAIGHERESIQLAAHPEDKEAIRFAAAGSHVPKEDLSYVSSQGLQLLAQYLGSEIRVANILDQKTQNRGVDVNEVEILRNSNASPDFYIIRRGDHFVPLVKE